MSQDNSETLSKKHETPQIGEMSSLGLPQELVEAVELMFFAYRDFVSDPDTILESHGFGRAHHRVLHFVGRRPGMSVSELLHILSITKQSLSRVLKDLIEEKYIIQETDEHDRRIKRLLLSFKSNEIIFAKVIVTATLVIKVVILYLVIKNSFFRQCNHNIINAESMNYVMIFDLWKRDETLNI